MDTSTADLLLKATDIRAAAYPIRSIILDVLFTIKKAKIEELVVKRDFTESQVRQIASDAGHGEPEVADVLRRFLQFDLSDYSSAYRSYANAYELSGELTKAEACKLIKSQPDCLFCILHNRVCRWCPARSEFTDFVIENSVLHQVLKGHLVNQGRAFGTTIELLSRSYREAWPQWQSLWQYF